MSLLVTGCVTQRHLTIGCYRAGDNYLLVYYQIELKRDSSYIFYSGGDIYKTMQQGRWVVRNNKLVLNSYVQPTTKGYFTEALSDNPSEVHFILFDVYGTPLTNEDHVYLRQNSEYISLNHQNSNIYSIEKNKLNSGYSIGVGSAYLEVNIQILNPKANKICVYMVPDTKRFYQTNKRFTIKDSISFESKRFKFSKIACM